MPCRLIVTGPSSGKPRSDYILNNLTELIILVIHLGDGIGTFVLWYLPFASYLWYLSFSFIIEDKAGHVCGFIEL